MNCGAVDDYDHVYLELCEEDIAEARRVGLARLARSRGTGLAQPFGDPGDDQREQIDVESSIAELGVARWLGLEWHPNTEGALYPRPPDVGSRVEVRWTKWLSGHLLVHDDDPDERIMVLVVGAHPRMRVRGWTTGWYGKRPYWNDTPRPGSRLSKMVPPGKLLSASLLPSMRSSL